MKVALAVCAAALVFPLAAAARVGGNSGFVFLWPADGILTSPYGPRPVGFHPGIDIGLLRSLDVRAASTGRVVAIGALTGYEGYGNVVVMDLGGGFTAVYAHLAKPLVHPGELLVPGATIGVAGCTGWCTGTHVHFELRNRGRPIDPLFLFGLGYTAPSTQGG